VSPSESALGATSSFSLGSSTAPRVVAPPENEPTASYCRSSAIKVPKTGYRPPAGSTLGARIG